MVPRKSNPYFYNGILDAQITKYWKLDIKIKDINVCKKDELIEENCIFYDCITENCIAFKSFWKKEYGELLNDKEVQEIISILEVECYESKNKIQRNHRIYTKGRMLIYQLNTDNNTSVRIEDGECEIEETPDFMFYTDRNFKNQVEPDLSVMPEELLPYIRKHFNVKDEDDVILISILIVYDHVCNGTGRIKTYQ